MTAVLSSTLFAAPVTQVEAADLHIVAATDAADATARSVPQVTTVAGATFGENDAIAVASAVTVDGRQLTPGLWYWPVATIAGEVNALVQLSVAAAPIAVAGTVNNLLGRWEPAAPVAADGNIVTGVDYRTATTMKVGFRLVSDAWARVGEVPMVGSYTGYSDGLLVWFQDGHCRVGFVDDDTGTVIFDDIATELEILWIEVYKLQDSTGAPTQEAGTALPHFIRPDDATGRMTLVHDKIQLVDDTWLAANGDNTLFLPNPLNDGNGAIDTPAVYFQVKAGNGQPTLLSDGQGNVALNGAPQTLEVALPAGLYSAEYVAAATEWRVTSLPHPEAAGASSTVTARFKPNTDYVAGDSILEIFPIDGKSYVWTADADFTSGPDPDFDGDGWTRQEEVTNATGSESHIVNSDVTARLFSGSSIAKGLDILQDVDEIPRLFRSDLATQIYGHGGGQVAHAIDPDTGYLYAVRPGQTIDDDRLPSQSEKWILVYPGNVPTNAIADILATPYADLVALTGFMVYAVDTHELLMWDTGATPENVAPRKTYSAAAEPVQFVTGKWVVHSPQPPGGEDSHVLLVDEAGTVGADVVQASESLTAIKNNYMHLEVYSLSDGFGNPLHSPGALLLTEHLTHDVPFQIDLGGRALTFKPQDNGAANMTLVNESANAGQQNFKLYGVKKQTTVVTVDTAALAVDMAGAVAGDGAEFADDGNGGLKLIAKAHQTSANVTLNGTTDADGNTVIPYVGAVENGYQVEIEFSPGRWIPQHYGEPTSVPPVYFQALYDSTLKQFELHGVGADAQNKPYRVTVYGADPVQAAPLRLITSHVPAQITRTTETDITVLTLAIPSDGTWQVNAQCVVEGVNDVIPTMRVQDADTNAGLIQGAASKDVGEGNSIFDSVMFTALKTLVFTGPTNLRLAVNWAANDDQQFIFDHDSRTFFQALKVD